MPTGLATTSHTHSTAGTLPQGPRVLLLHQHPPHGPPHNAIPPHTPPVPLSALPAPQYIPAHCTCTSPATPPHRHLLPASTPSTTTLLDQIVEWANKSEDKNNGKTLMQVIALVFEKVMEQVTWSEMYVQLCWKMMKKLSLVVRDESTVLQDSKAIAGGQLVRKYFLHWCQEEFEHGWAVKEATAMAAAKKLQTRRRAVDVCEGWMGRRHRRQDVPAS
ncbi:hypothetical protein C0993_008608 [Termitomyces sp. T159_Od127]|nr:hypothetical protein C0993_008608 [Termitomyces sp. T159_Od127]